MKRLRRGAAALALLLSAASPAWTENSSPEKKPSPLLLLSPEQRRMLEEAQRQAMERERRLTPQQKAARDEFRRRMGNDLREVLNSLRTPPQEQPLIVNGHKRSYLIHLPPGYDGKKALPTVVDFYVGGGPMFRLEQVRMNRVADRFEFIVVYPYIPADGSREENAAFIGALLDDLRLRYALDARRIYAAGAGAGGALAYSAARDFSQRIAAASAVEPLETIGEAKSQRPVPVAYFSLSGPSASTRLPAWVSWWIKADHCQAAPTQGLRRDGYALKRYEPAVGHKGAPVFLYQPVSSPKDAVILPGGFYSGGWSQNSGKADARALMWRFFEQHPLSPDRL